MKINEMYDEDVFYYYLIMENHDDIDIISKLLFEFTSHQNIEDYKKFLYGNERIGYFLPCKIYENSKEYKKFKEYYETQYKNK